MYAQVYCEYEEIKVVL